MKPCVKIEVGTGRRGYENLPGATVRSSSQRRVETLKAGQSREYLIDRPGDVLYIEALSHHLTVTVTNRTSVPLALETTIPSGDKLDRLDDVLGHGKSHRIQSGARLKISI